MSSLKLEMLLLFVLSFPNSVFAEPRGRLWDQDVSDIGLPSGNEVGLGLLIAIFAIPLGYLFLNLGNKDNSSDGVSFAGCLGLIFIGGGIICLLPLVAWILSVASILIGIGIGLVIIIGILVLIFGNKK